jgi:hypothetical protein
MPRTLLTIAVALLTPSVGRAAVLVSENFESLALQPFQSPTESGGDGTDWTPSLPAGWNMIFSGPAGDPIEWQGWRAVDVDSWIATEGNQERATWSRALIGAHDTVLVADPDAYDDTTNIDTGLFNTWITTPVVNLGTVFANTVTIEFDSFWRNEVTQVGTLEVSFDGGSNYSNLLTYDPNLFADGQVIDERLLFNVSNPAAGQLIFRFGLTNASNDWWWAVDDVVISGTVVPEPAAGILAGMVLFAGMARRRRPGE